MKRSFAIIMTAALSLGATPALARTSQGGFSNQCFREVYREEYTPGTASSPGTIRRWTESVEVPCAGGGTTTILEDPFDRPVHPSPHHDHIDDNSCMEGSIIGGILGGGAGAAASRGDGRWWAIPLGITGGALIGCQLDGG